MRLGYLHGGANISRPITASPFSPKVAIIDGPLVKMTREGLSSRGTLVRVTMEVMIIRRSAELDLKHFGFMPGLSKMEGSADCA